MDWTDFITIGAYIVFPVVLFLLWLKGITAVAQHGHYTNRSE